MTIDDVMLIGNHALYTIIICAAPVLLVSLVIGLAVSIFQTVTSIQEQTLTFVPKVLGIFIALALFGQWMLNTMAGFLADLWADFSIYIR
ncbi:MAG: flagellar biosynthesis protein FliQ [Lachnospiraceae bacterium]|nr:flagellar biosynthesis protein FliQ [Lachnospiraceae bacterium]